MTVGEGIAVGCGVLVLAVGAYALVQTNKADQAESARMQAQLAAQLAAAQRPPAQQAHTGNTVADIGIGLFNAVGGVNGIFDLVDRFAD